jgi:hydroxyacylglutathione hydrolase
MLLHRSLTVADGVHFYLWVGYILDCNSIVLSNVLEGPKPHVLVDPGMTSDGRGEDPLASLAEAMAGDGLRLEDVGLVVGTHSHPDHFQAVDRVVSLTGAAVAMSSPEYRFMRGIGGAMYGSFGTRVPSSEISIVLEEGELPLNGSTTSGIDVIIAPGHSPGCACLYLRDSKVLVSGDVVFPGSIGRMDLPGGSVSQMRESIERLSKMDIEHILPGHSSLGGPVVSGKDNVVRNFQMVRMFF